MRKPPASGVASKTRLPRQSITATPLMYLGHKKWFTGAGAGLRNAARRRHGQAVGGQHPLRPVLNTSTRFCPGVPGTPGHFLKYFQGLLNVFSLWIEGLGNLRCETADGRWTTWMLPREGHEDLLWRELDEFSSQTVRNTKTLYPFRYQVHHWMIWIMSPWLPGQKSSDATICGKFFGRDALSCMGDMLANVQK
ncbi:uncharacterized protein LOC128144930 isoform X2 [Harpia harpyja]|uniref:uncharacterized protein LOC128144930 isoform X2 n=1 Tax=Harpia harpyja TaxID=202280 RepID=UPI0022B093D2|nr:uncharacterized protein LOC128144930 isoform X2 [Harpia harpyja]